MIFDVGPFEFIALAVIALLVLGPDKLPRYAADAARMLRQLRRMANEARAEVTRELGPELKDISMADVNPRALVRRHLLDDLDDPDGVGSSDVPVAQGSPSKRSGPTASGPPSPYDMDTT